MSRFLEAHLASLAIGSAVALGLYVFYGPPSGLRHRRGELRGLTNSGNHCFVNAVVQALASCSALQAWLEGCCTKRDVRTVRGALLDLLKLLNNLSPSPASTHSPALLLASLRAHGWRINTEEQDAHEMLHVIMASVEEELAARAGAGGRPTHASLLDISSLGLRQGEEEGEKEEEEEEEEGEEEEEKEEEASPAGGPFSSPGRHARGMSLPPTPAQEGPPRSPWDGGRAVSVSRDSSPGGSRRPARRRSNSGVFSKLGSQLPSNVVSAFTKPKCQTPFTGLLTCKVVQGPSPASSPVTYSTFDNITLSLPSSTLGAVSLDTLLQMFVSCERVEGGPVKQTTFGKLPDCLCFHIQRTGFAGGQPYKRHDYVEFPVLLNMDRYTHTSQLVRARALAALGSPGPASAPASLLPQSLQAQYQLRAVVVHSGGIHSGHYVTYRRGPLGSKSSSRWFHTSDSTVKQVPFSEVSRAPAYMLFYERDLLAL